MSVTWWSIDSCATKDMRVFPFVLSLSTHESLTPFDELRANG
ncbi:MAG TPA: hypothetical protein PLU72_07440 [Candidatus Ozemobacteraceae bacterium]|nr:hypothetical protein [Candidatus Ozemobacteraceae bacterium]